MMFYYESNEVIRIKKAVLAIEKLTGVLSLPRIRVDGLVLSNGKGGFCRIFSISNV